MLFTIRGFKYNQLATGWPAGPSRKRSYMKALCWPLFMADWALNSASSQALVSGSPFMEPMRSLRPCLQAALFVHGLTEQALG